MPGAVPPIIAARPSLDCHSSIGLAEFSSDGFMLGVRVSPTTKGNPDPVIIIARSVVNKLLASSLAVYLITRKQLPVFKLCLVNEVHCLLISFLTYRGAQTSP